VVAGDRHAAGDGAVFHPRNGRKYVLLHDEDYCAHPEIAPAQPDGGCDQLNADAADADMNAAYFMQETGNLANATAWMLGPIRWRGSGCEPEHAEACLVARSG